MTDDTMDGSPDDRMEAISRQLGAIAAGLGPATSGELAVPAEHWMTDEFGRPELFYTWELHDIDATAGCRALKARCAALGVKLEITMEQAPTSWDLKTEMMPDMQHVVVRLSGW